MRDKLRAIERKIEILKTLTVKKQSTCRALAEEFNVSVATIIRDITDISKLAPIYTKRGNQGGIYILPEYRSYRNYLTEEQERCLYELMEVANKNQQCILCDIIFCFTLNINSDM